MAKSSVIFFGSFHHYSTIILEALYSSPDIKVLAVVTTPPAAAGRKQEFRKTHTHIWAEAHNLPVFTPEKLTKAYLKSNIYNLGSCNFFVVAGYRLLLPPAWLAYPQIAALNFHPSLLPQYPGPAPVEWALLKGDQVTGISIIKMTEKYDQGPIIAQQKLPIISTDTRLTLYQKLYELGAQMLIPILSKRVRPLKPIKSDLNNKVAYAKRLSRTDSYIPWSQVKKALQGQDAADIERKIRAFTGYPEVWTQVPTPKGHLRLKFLSAHLQGSTLKLDQVQLEGKNPSTFNQIKNLIKP